MQAQGERQCAKKCIARECDTANLAYGRFCGIAHTGCPGVEPCDAADACCQRHDDCVGRAGLMGANVRDGLPAGEGDAQAHGLLVLTSVPAHCQA